MAPIVYQTPRNKRKKRIKSEHLLDFTNFNFPEHSCKNFSGAFRDNVRVFLQEFAEIQEYTINKMTVWCTMLIEDQGNEVFPLYTVEEVLEQESVDPFCNHCEASGWGHHYVCKRKYHFIIPAKESREMELNWNFPETKNHNLYGLIHYNGYGHLICVKGVRTNSNLFAADDCMMFWNRLCTVLKARFVSICNITGNEAIELNLIHGLLYQETWFGKWGYEFSGGEECEKAISFLSSLSLERIVSDLKNNSFRKRVKEMVEMYRDLAVNYYPLITIGDLLKFILEFESGGGVDIRDKCRLDIEKSEGGSETQMGFERFIECLMMRNSRWSRSRLEDVFSVIVDSLKSHQNEVNASSCGKSRQELRDEARKTIGDTGLIDFMLKCIKCIEVDNQIIYRVTNPSTKLTEFKICDSFRHQKNGLDVNWPNDVMFLYKNVLLHYGETGVVLNMNRFVRMWPIDANTEDKSMRLICKVLPSFDELETMLSRSLSPGVVVVVQPWMTIGELKAVVQRTLRCTYCVMDRFQVTQIGGLKAVEDDKVLYEVFKPGSQVWVRGRGIDLDTPLMYEDGFGFRH